MAKRLQYKRLLALAVLLVAGFFGLGYRLVDLQVFRHDELAVKALENTQQEMLLEPRRGDILDCRGNLLATSIFVKTVCADPSLIGNRAPEVARILAPFLQKPEVQLVQQLTPRTRQNDKGETVTNAYVILKRKVSSETWQKIQGAMTNLSFGLDEKKLAKTEREFYRLLRQKAVFAETLDDQLRVYPNQSLAAHVLGYVGGEDREENGHARTLTVGREGIEQSFDSKLRGVQGWRVTERDRHQREMVTFRDQNVEAMNGLNVVLTIDSVLQHILETALAEGMDKHSPISISGIVVRPRTGEVLAMATLPTFDPNSPGNASADARRNRVVTDVAEPGSTFKIVVVSSALNEKAVRMTDVFDCEHGHFYYAGRNLHDHQSYGDLPVEKIITKSSNIGAAKIGIKLGEDRLYNYMRDFGFGTRTAIPVPGEVPGILHPVKKWSKVSIAQIPMGQGVAVTRLQMAMAMCTIANGGWLMRPMLVERLEDNDHNVVARYAPQRVRQVISESVAKQMVAALKTVVTSDGTAPAAALTHYTVAGKTGTAQKAEHGVYAPGKYFSSFIGFFPADNPELCISVTMDEPKGGHYGGETTAPVFHEIAERAANYLNIRPEDGEAPSLADSGLPSENLAVRKAVARTPQ
jgi:cell division protein FtsI/penicillin-binding protein 2